MNLPDSLPAQFYLLTYNPDSERIAGSLRSGYLGPGLRAAAFVELLRRGRIVDANGKVALAARPRPGAPATGAGVLPDDPILLRVLGQLESARRPHSWAYWIGRDARGTTRCTRDYLEAGGWLLVDRTRTLGIIGRTTVTLRDTRMARALIEDVRRALVGETPIGRLDDRVRQLAALGALAEVRVLFGWREQRAHRERAGELADGLGQAGKALRKVIRTEKAAGAAASGAG